MSMVEMVPWGQTSHLLVESGLLGTVESDKACIRDRDYKLHLDVFDTEERLRAEEVLPTKGELAHSWRAPRALPAAIGVINSQEIRIT